MHCGEYKEETFFLRMKITDYESNSGLENAGATPIRLINSWQGVDYLNMSICN